MKKALVLMVALILFTVGAVAGPTIGFRTWPGSTVIPLLGVQYAASWNPYIEAFKTDIWSLTWAGQYMIEGGFAVPFTWGNTPIAVPIGVALPITVTTAPVSLTFERPLGVIGLWIDGGHGRYLGIEGYYDNSAWLISLGVRIDLHGIWLMLHEDAPQTDSVEVAE